MRWKIVILTMILGTVTGFAQEEKPIAFEPPIDPPLLFSGNFGEIRTNHFHGGLDFKTGGKIGKPVYALADGYISRIRVTLGSGYVLDVCYDNGYSTINRHLSAFMSPIAERVEELQYEKESWEVEILPGEDEYRVKAGQQIAWSGNTGYSFGPHLHLDVFETESGDYVDPMPHFKSAVKDTKPPRATHIMLFPQLWQGVVEGVQENRAYPIHSEPVEAWGIIGVGIKAYDYMEGTTNHYGVYSVTLSVDSVVVFQSTVDRFSQAENRMINSWTYGQYMKSYIEPGNFLRMLKAYNGNRGLLTIDEERDYHLEYVLQDVFGNTSKYAFVIRGRKQPIAALDMDSQYLVKYDRTNYIQEPGMKLVIPKGCLYDDALLSGKVYQDTGSIAYTYQLNGRRLPLHKACELRIALRRKPLQDSTKYYVARVVSGKQYSVGGTYEQGEMKANIMELGTYTVAIDTVPPKVLSVGKTKWKANNKIVLRVSDVQTGISRCRGTIDGKYALFGRPNSISSYWECVLEPEHVEKGKRHVLEFVAIDGCGNTAVLQESFVW